MSSISIIFFDPTTVRRRSLRGSSQLFWTWATMPVEKRMFRNTTSGTSA
jgi:hypothetical protein